MIRIRSLQWTPLHIAHIQRHGVTIREVEEVRRNPFIVRPTYGGRYLVVGATNERRILALILDPLGDEEFFCVTARSASRRERRERTGRYEETQS